MHRRDQGSLLANYNSLRDEHLATFNSDPKRLRHFKQMGLISGDNIILDEHSIRENLVRRQQQKQANGMLADSVVSRAIDLERKRRIDIKKKLEFLDKIEKVEKVRNTRHHPAGIEEFDPYDTSHASKAPDLTADPYTKDLEKRRAKLSGYTTASDFRIIPGRSQSPYMDIRLLSKSLGIPIIKPRPPSAPRPVQTFNKSRRAATMRRVQTVSFTVPKSSPYHTNSKITLCYMGKSVSLNGFRSFEGSEVMVLQQHCGGNTLTLFRGSVKPKDNFHFVSKRHIGSPFGLTIYLDGMIDVRVSGCCEYRHGPGKMLGQTIAHFKVVAVEGGNPCYRCKEASEGRPRSVAVHSSQASIRQGRESKAPKSTPVSDIVKTTPKKTPTKITLKKTALTGSPKTTSKKTKKKRKSRTRKTSQENPEELAKEGDGDNSDRGSGYDNSSDSDGEEGVASAPVVVAISSDEMSVKYSDYKYQIAVTSDEESADEIIHKRVSSKILKPELKEDESRKQDPVQSEDAGQSEDEAIDKSEKEEFSSESSDEEEKISNKTSSSSSSDEESISEKSSKKGSTGELPVESKENELTDAFESDVETSDEEEAASLKEEKKSLQENQDSHVSLDSKKESEKDNLSENVTEVEKSEDEDHSSAHDHASTGKGERVASESENEIVSEDEVADLATDEDEKVKGKGSPEVRELSGEENITVDDDDVISEGAQSNHTPKEDEISTETVPS